MTPAQLQQIANFLNTSVTKIEYARQQFTFKGGQVLLVRVSGKSPRFVSKKVIMFQSNWDENNSVSQADAMTEKFADANQIPLTGSQKQISWAESIRRDAIRSIAIEVLQGEKSEKEAWKILETKSASWWIENRANWRETKLEKEQVRAKRTRLLTERFR